MSKSFVVLASFAILCLIGAGPTTQESNLLPNGGFEQGMSGWSLGNDYDMSKLTPDATHSGTRGLRVKDEDAEKGSSIASQKVPATPGKSYVVKFYARRVKQGGVSVYIQFFDKAGTSLNTSALKNQNSTAVKNKGDDAEVWREYISKPAIAPDNAATVRVYIHSTNADTGTVDFDDFVLAEEKSGS